MREPLIKQGHNYVSVPNEFFDVWLKELNGSECNILCFLMRKTLGWNKLEDWISLSQFKANTGLSIPTLIANLRTLQDKGMIFCRAEGTIESGSQKLFYTLNAKETDTSNETLDPSKETLQDTLLNNLIAPSKETLDTKDIYTTKDKSQKQNLVRNFSDFFCEQFLNAKWNKERKKYFYQGAKDTQLIQKMLKHLDITELKALCAKFMSSDDDFIKKAGYTIGVFYSQVNKLQVSNSRNANGRLKYVPGKKPLTLSDL